MATNAMNSPVEREVPAHNNPRDFIVRVTGAGLYIREKGRRTTYGPVSWDYIFLKAAQLNLASDRSSDPPKPKPKRRVSRGLLTTGR